MADPDFYVFPSECMACGAPESVAPDLMSHTEERYGNCYFVRQPVTPGEVDRAIAAVNASCCGAVVYRGKDPEILGRIGFDIQRSADGNYWPGDSLVQRHAVIPERLRLSLRVGFGVTGAALLFGSVGKAIFVSEPTASGAAWVFAIFLFSIFLIGASKTL